jgi:HSP20 family molecular chaperone IbpA
VSKETPKQATEYPIIVETRKLLDRMKEVSESIAKRAYEFFEQRGREVGRDIDDWLHAEMEVLRPVPIEITEADGELKISAEAPGFSAKDLQVAVEPRRVIISGKTEKTHERETGKTVYSERRSKEIFRALDLPVEVDPTRTAAGLKDGILQLTVAKALPAAPVKVDIKVE